MNNFRGYLKCLLAEMVTLSMYQPGHVFQPGVIAADQFVLCQNGLGQARYDAVYKMGGP